VSRKRSYTYWDVKRVKEAIATCKTRREVERKYPYVYYRFAQFGDREKLLKNLPLVSQLRQVRPKSRPFKDVPIEDLCRIAQLYATRNVFKFNAQSAYRECIQRGALDLICMHMRQPLRKHTITSMRAIARTMTPQELERKDPYVYQTLMKHKKNKVIK
jgi:hypothetical protein